MQGMEVCRNAFQFTPLREGRRCLNFRSRLPISFQFTPLREGRRRSGTERDGTAYYFNSRPSARGDVRVSAGSPLLRYFNSRPSARGDFVQKLLRILGIEFQFTPLREGRRHGQGLYRADYDFNSRPSARGDHRRRSRDGSPVLFQFTPLREGRRIVKNNNLKIPKFQFTPLREGRLRIAITPFFAVYFNSRPSARGDLQRRNRHARIAISIHAPPRGATAGDV